MVKSGLVVTDALVVVDRQQGGTANLENSGIKIHSLTTLSQVNISNYFVHQKK